MAPNPPFLSSGSELLLAAVDLSPQSKLLIHTAVAVIGLIFLVGRMKLHAFLALILAALYVGFAGQLPLSTIAKTFYDGVGATLGLIAVVVGLGTMLGKLLAESGGAQDVAQALIRLLGRDRLPWALMLAGFVVGLPVFFGVGVVLLIPIVFTLARETGASLLTLGLPLIAGLSVSHGLIPPHPGPIAAIERLHADMGKTILYSMIIGLPCAVLAGPLFMRLVAHRHNVPLGGVGAQLGVSGSAPRSPGVAWTVLTITLPIILMLGDTVARIQLPPESAIRNWASFIGAPLVAMLLAVLFSLWSLGTRCGFNRSQLLKFTEDCVGPAAGIMLVVGAGGGFSKVLDIAGVDDAIAAVGKSLKLSPLLLGWLVAACIRIAVGSATVAITLAATILAPIADAVPGTNRELLVIALGAGSLIASHVNDGGFWFVRDYLNLSVAQTLKTWTILETIIAVAALVLALLLDLMF